jgi:hypothetical protein
MLGESERQERVWDSGSVHSTELADIDAQLEDLKCSESSSSNAVSMTALVIALSNPPVNASL